MRDPADSAACRQLAARSVLAGASRSGAGAAHGSHALPTPARTKLVARLIRFEVGNEHPAGHHLPAADVFVAALRSGPGTTGRDDHRHERPTDDRSSDRSQSPPRNRRDYTDRPRDWSVRRRSRPARWGLAGERTRGAGKATALPSGRTISWQRLLQVVGERAADRPIRPMRSVRRPPSSTSGLERAVTVLPPQSKLDQARHY